MSMPSIQITDATSAHRIWRIVKYVMLIIMFTNIIFNISNKDQSVSGLIFLTAFLGFFAAVLHIANTYMTISTFATSDGIVVKKGKGETLVEWRNIDRIEVVKLSGEHGVAENLQIVTNNGTLTSGFCKAELINDLHTTVEALNRYREEALRNA